MVLKEFDLEGKTAIVTGAGRGIGKAIALTLAEAGVDVVVTARTVSQIEQTATEVRKLGRKSLAIPTDVGQTDQVEKMVEATIAQFGKVDIMVANAGMDIMKPLLLVDGQLPVPMRAAVKLDSGLTDQDWATMINVDIMGVVRCARAVGPHMIKQRSGKIINIGSIEGYGHVDGENDTAYALAKAAVHRFTQALALEWAPFNINVNVIAPGYYHTEILRHPEWNITSQEAHASIANFRGGDMRDLGLLAVFMASDAANFMTGEIITCDGGTLKRGKLMGEEKVS